MVAVGDVVALLAEAGYKLLVVAIVLAVGWAIGRGAGFAIRKLMIRMGADSIFRKTSVGRAIMKSGYTASTFSESVAKWLIYIAAALVALQSLSIGFVTAGVTAFMGYLPTLAAGIVILIAGFVLSDWFGEFLKRGIPQEQRETLYINVAADVAKVVMYFLTITIVLKEMGVDVTILYIVGQAFAWGIAIAVGIIVGIVAGWALKDRVKGLLPG